MSPAEIMQEINASIGFDKALAPQDIAGSKAHATMLAAQGIITKGDAREIVKGLEKGEFEIHFPKRFTLWLKALRLLGDGPYFAAIRRATGL